MIKTKGIEIELSTHFTHRIMRELKILGQNRMNIIVRIENLKAKLKG